MIVKPFTQLLSARSLLSLPKITPLLSVRLFSKLSDPTRTDKYLTVYGRQTVFDIMDNKDVKIERIHVAREHTNHGIVPDIVDKATRLGIDVNLESLKRIGRVCKHETMSQGVAADVITKNMLWDYQIEKSEFRNERVRQFFRPRHKGISHWIALNGLTTPRNVGMAIRSAAAAGVDGIIYPEIGNCHISNPLVLHSSVGSLFRVNILRTHSLVDCIRFMREHFHVNVVYMDTHSEKSLFGYEFEKGTGKVPVVNVFVFGNEAHGVDPDVRKISDLSLRIPMVNDIESLNVAQTISIVSYYTQYFHEQE